MFHRPRRCLRRAATSPGCVVNASSSSYSTSSHYCSLFFNGIRTCPPRAANQPSPDHKPETAKPSNPLHPRGYSISVLIAQRPAVPAVCKKRISKALLTPVNHWHPTVVNDLAEGGKPPANRVFWGSSARPPECPTDPALFDFCSQDFNRNQRNQTTPFLIHPLHT